MVYKEDLQIKIREHQLNSNIAKLLIVHFFTSSLYFCLILSFIYGIIILSYGISFFLYRKYL